MNNYSQFSIDSMGRNAKIVEVSGGSTSGTRQFVWSEARWAEERDGSGSIVRQFFATGELIGSNPYYYTKDLSGSIREFTDNSGNIQAQYGYDMFGDTQTLSETTPASFKFAGYYRHQPSRLNLTMYRQYSSTNGRWLSRDPMGFSQGTNLYAFVANSPILLHDELGLEFRGNATGMSAITGAPGSYTSMGCRGIVSWYLGIKPDTLPENAPRTTCWIGPNAQQHANEHHCRCPYTKKRIWAREGDWAGGNPPSTYPGTDTVQNPSGAFTPGGTPMNYFVFDPNLNEWAGMENPWEGYTQPNCPHSPTNTSPIMWCVTCLSSGTGGGAPSK